MLRVGIVGAGGFSETHLRAFAANPKVKLAWISDPDTEKAQKRAQTHEIPRVLSDYRYGLDDDSIDLIDILTPHHLHCSIAVDSLEACKDVICIKPMALTLGECDRMIDASHRTGRRLIVSFHQRFDPVHQRVEEMLRSGEFEQPVTIFMRYCVHDAGKIMRPGNWYGSVDKCGGGRLFSGGSHWVDVLLSWLGRVHTVTAFTRRLVARYDDPDLERENAGSDDHASCIFESGKGTVGTFVSSWANPLRVNEKFIYGTERALHVYEKDGANHLEILEHGSSPRLLLKQESWRQRSFQTAVDNHIECLLNADEEPYSLDDVRHTMEVLIACYESSNAGRRVDLVPDEKANAV